MASLVCFTCVNSAVTPNHSSNSPSVPIPKSNISFPKNQNPNLNLIPSPRLIRPLKAKEDDAHDGNQTKTKTNSILCSDCDGNGAIACTQCEGTGVNSKDHFNGQFKAGALCWLCRGKRDILCGNCNGAGFLGGFMNAFED